MENDEEMNGSRKTPILIFMVANFSTNYVLIGVFYSSGDDEIRSQNHLLTVFVRDGSATPIRISRT